MMEYKERINACIDAYTVSKGMYDMYDNLCRNAEENLRRAQENCCSLESCIPIVQAIAGKLQNNVKDKIISIVQTALDATFPGLTFAMEFVTRREKTECDVYIIDEEGGKQTIIDGCGGGVKDIIAFALRIAIWALDNSSSPVIFLDEPMKFVSEGLRQQSANLLHVLSKKLGIQFVVVSHVAEIVNSGDTIYIVNKNTKGISKTELLENIKN